MGKENKKLSANLTLGKRMNSIADEWPRCLWRARSPFYGISVDSVKLMVMPRWPWFLLWSLVLTACSSSAVWLFTERLANQGYVSNPVFALMLGSLLASGLSVYMLLFSQVIVVSRKTNTVSLQYGIMKHRCSRVVSLDSLSHIDIKTASCSRPKNKDWSKLTFALGPENAEVCVFQTDDVLLLTRTKESIEQLQGTGRTYAGTPWSDDLIERAVSIRSSSLLWEASYNIHVSANRLSISPADKFQRQLIVAMGISLIAAISFLVLTVVNFSGFAWFWGMLSGAVVLVAFIAFHSWHRSSSVIVDKSDGLSIQYRDEEITISSGNVGTLTVYVGIANPWFAKNAYVINLIAGEGPKSQCVNLVPRADYASVLPQAESIAEFLGAQKRFGPRVRMI
jgi:hypothetical protein